MSDHGAPGDGPAGPRTRRGTWLAVASIVVGGGLVVWALVRPVSYASFGWFAYAPLSGTTYSPVAPGLAVTLGLFGAGALLIGLGAGFLLGRRRG
ncbi:hypothetical protein AAG589_15960 [Isoptericola sp. F-RaC21]|uniref:hypothetical protein n=1 Tax=Isoptericola sp. F-RaC21 TaxID=3141452 RepID=UPI00315BBEE9